MGIAFDFAFANKRWSSIDSAGVRDIARKMSKKYRDEKEARSSFGAPPTMNKHEKKGLPSTNHAQTLKLLAGTKFINGTVLGDLLNYEKEIGHVPLIDGFRQDAVHSKD